MTLVQVSNARRIGFTALAVVAFWVLAYRAYWMGYGGVPFRPGTVIGGPPTWIDYFWANSQSLTSVSFGLIPAILLSLSVHNFPLKLRDRWILISAILFSSTMAVCYGLGESDADASREVSWLLLPLILTTAFVIFGAWRSAVRAATVVPEDDE